MDSSVDDSDVRADSTVVVDSRMTVVDVGGSAVVGWAVVVPAAVDSCVAVGSDMEVVDVVGSEVVTCERSVEVSAVVAVDDVIELSNVILDVWTTAVDDAVP